nr:hypothetical protein [Tanacetum cinerariifolium]
MYRPSYELPSSQPNQGYSLLNRINLDMDTKNLFNMQDFYAGQVRVKVQADHSALKQVEKPLFYTKQNPSSKKAKTSETTSGSEQGDLNLNEEADGSEEEVREMRPIVRGRAKKKASSSSRFESSSVA